MNNPEFYGVQGALPPAGVWGVPNDLLVSLAATGGTNKTLVQQVQGARRAP
jgi:hypothetical protein